MALSVMQWSREQMQMSAVTSHRLNEIAEIDADLQTIWLQSDLLPNISSLPINKLGNPPALPGDSKGLTV
jgi:hypothetical protein